MKKKREFIGLEDCPSRPRVWLNFLIFVGGEWDKYLWIQYNESACFINVCNCNVNKENYNDVIICMQDAIGI